MQKFLNNARRTSPNLTYLLVPERHKDGALHFHALIGNLNASMSDSGRKWLHRPIFNLTSFKYGFTNFTRIENKQKTANYCRKYITKELMTDKYKKRYWRSKNLQLPERTYNENMIDLIKTGTLDLSSASEYENDHVQSFTFPLIDENKPYL